jgi:hypothetical protein
VPKFKGFVLFKLKNDISFYSFKCFAKDPLTHFMVMLLKYFGLGGFSSNVPLRRISELVKLGRVYEQQNYFCVKNGLNFQVPELHMPSM